ncbi:hypothetical protein [Methylobacterium sp. 1030]|uniref:hypothetical protein n=1 Tax=Methylobacterium sp. 1030 TaxID=3156404 RepID=UPI0033929F26
MSDELAAAHERGQHLGPRALHIQAGGERLLELSRQLKFVFDDLDQSLAKLGMQEQVDILRHMLSMIHDLAITAQQFQPRA